MKHLIRPRSAMQVWLLAIVVMALLLRPVLDITTEVHLAEHGVAAKHALADASSSEEAGCAQDAGLERAHGLSHQENSGSVCADLSVELFVPLLVFTPRFGTSPPAVRLPTRYLPTPFKPPIA